ncbi:MAG: hypothetical protein HF314_19180 [Ignavibacteria bacterium]|jgi:hypothetical protein|nr:hypothetical protein [Ignavibacteria bacterium]MCU7505212.1 hypothetical protein [Ignavibacteria bacterium]MCU7517294.1 hypothetical protein [Ignavibacteria bacterium]
MLILASGGRISAQTVDKSAEIKISDAPGSNEIRNEFLLAKKGKHDVYSVVGKISSKKDNFQKEHTKGDGLLSEIASVM